MAVNMGSLTFRMAADVAQLRKDMTEAKGLVGHAASGITGTINALKKTLGFIGVGFAVREVGRFLRDLSRDVDDLSEKAAGLNLGTIALAEMRQAAGDSGVKFEELAVGVNKLNNSIGDAAAGVLESKAAFDALGVSYKNANGQARSTEDVMRDIADVFARHRDSAEKSAIANDLFGKSGYKLIDYLNKGSDALRQNTKLTEEAIKAAKEMEGHWDAWAQTWQSIKNSAATTILPFLNDMVSLLKQLNLGLIVSGASWANPLGGVKELYLQEQKILKQREQARKALEWSAGLGDISGREHLRGALSTLSAPQRPGSKPKAPKELAADSDDIAAARAYENTMRGLIEQINGVKDATHVQRLEARLAAGDFGFLTESIRPLLMAKAKLADDIARATEETERYNAQIQIEKDRLKDLDQALDGYTDRLEDARKIQETQRLEMRLAAGEVFTKEELEAIVKGIARINSEVKDVKSSAQELGLTFTSHIEEAILKGGELKDVLRGVFDDALRMLIRKNFTEPFLEFVGQIGKGSSAGGAGVNGALGGIFSFFANNAGGFSDFLFSIFGGMASGGRISGPKMVGEKGVELFVPDSPGRIVPNHALGGVTINQTYQIDSRSDRATIIGAMEHTRRQTIASIVDMQRRNVPALRS